MVIMSAKVSKRKVLTGLIVAVAVVLLLVFLLGKAGETPAAAATQESTAAEIDAGTNEGRVAFLQSFGWEVAETPAETQEVKIPAEFNNVFTRYNQLQQSQGYDLSQYAGKAVKRYVYAITNYPGEAESQCHFATVLVYQDQVIGGDVTDTRQGGKMHGFAMPAA